MSVPYPTFDETRPCLGKHEIFTPDAPTERTVAQAKSICGGCPFQERCLRYALRFNVIGVWGATTEAERRALRARMGTQATKLPGQRTRNSQMSPR